MAGYDLDIHIEPSFHNEARSFFRFLQIAGRRYPIHIRYRTVTLGNFYVTIDGTPGGKIDAFFQELVLNKGLYYYGCSIQSRGTVTRKVIKPIFQALLDSRFDNTYPNFLIQHTLGKSIELSVPGSFFDPSAHKYEVLFRRWDLGMIGGYEFVLELDDLLTELMLHNLDFPKGSRSPNFGTLVGQFSQVNGLMSGKVKEIFRKIHALRTKGLHRNERDLVPEQVYPFALEMYFFFEYYDEFQTSQSTKSIRLNGRLYRRVRWGYEKDEHGNTWSKTMAEKPCGDCRVLKGQYHIFDCDLEMCPRCKGQALTCNCIRDDELK